MSRGTMLLRHRLDFVEFGLKSPRRQFLGSGSFGAAYKIPLFGGSVLKLTRDPYEMIASVDLATKKTKHIVPIYGVWTLEDSYFGTDNDLVSWHVVHRGYLTPLSPSDSEIVNVLFELYHDQTLDLKLPQAHQRGMRSKWENLVKMTIEERGMPLQAYHRSMQLMTQIGAAVRELHDIGIDWADFHSSNLMQDASGVVRVADVGWGLMHEDTERQTEFLTPALARAHAQRCTSS